MMNKGGICMNIMASNMNVNSNLGDCFIEHVKQRNSISGKKLRSFLCYFLLCNKNDEKRNEDYEVSIDDSEKICVSILKSIPSLKKQMKFCLYEGIFSKENIKKIKEA